MEELVLQRLRAGRHDHSPTRHQRRHQIGKGLAGAGARFGDQGMAVRDGLFDRTCHRGLLVARREARHFPRERAVRA